MTASRRCTPWQARESLDLAEELARARKDDARMPALLEKIQERKQETQGRTRMPKDIMAAMLQMFGRYFDD